MRLIRKYKVEITFVTIMLIVPAIVIHFIFRHGMHTIYGL